MMNYLSNVIQINMIQRCIHSKDSFKKNIPHIFFLYILLVLRIMTYIFVLKHIAHKNLPFLKRTFFMLLNFVLFFIRLIAIIRRNFGLFGLFWFSKKFYCRQFWNELFLTLLLTLFHYIFNKSSNHSFSFTIITFLHKFLFLEAFCVMV